MSDLPDLPLFEEIEDISTSKNFLTYTQEEFNKTWNYYETESMPPEEKSLWNSPVRNQTSSPASTSGKSSPTRDEWDPMLWNMTLTKYVELEDLGQVAKTPFTPAMTSIDIVSNIVTNESDCCPNFNATKLIVPNVSDEVFMSAELSTSETGSNQIPLRKDISPPRKEAKQLQSASPSLSSIRRKLLSKESKIVSRKREFNCMTKGISNKVNHSQVKNRNGKKKLYEMGQFSDPKKERGRINALNAKKNRDWQKRLIARAHDKINKLKTINKKLFKTARKEKIKLLAAQQEVKLLKSQLGSSLQSINRSY